MTTLYGSPGQTGDPFTDRRRTGIGGSDAGAILGVSPFGSALSVWEDKRGTAAHDERAVSERMLWGQRLERAIIDGYAEDTGRKVRRTGRQLRRHPSIPFVVGHPDGETVDGRLLEVKATAMLDSRWGEDGSADIPAHYYAQVQHYLVLRGLRICDVIVLVGGREMHVFTVPYHPEFAEALLVEEAAFWERVVAGEPPEPDGSESAGATLRRMFPVAYGEEVVATPEVAQYAERYLAGRAIRDEGQGQMDLAAQSIQRFLGARERVIGPAFAASWSNRKGSVSWKETAGRYRDLLVPHYDDDALDAIADGTTGAPTRTFSLSRKTRREP